VHVVVATLVVMLGGREVLEPELRELAGLLAEMAAAAAPEQGVLEAVRLAATLE
jgi:hypothetical protein